MSKRHYLVFEIKSMEEMELYKTLVRPLLDSDLRFIAGGEMQAVTIWKEVNQEGIEALEEQERRGE